mmetsp:Transcript_34911/g.60061  ORF Transcript_34911/g.60061 Transcript_34911/m.60061 type:complete len:217 (+) Transcript_34911:1389-2039(+)
MARHESESLMIYTTVLVPGHGDLVINPNMSVAARTHGPAIDARQLDVLPCFVLDFEAVPSCSTFGPDQHLHNARWVTAWEPLRRAKPPIRCTALGECFFQQRHPSALSASRVHEACPSLSIRCDLTVQQNVHPTMTSPFVFAVVVAVKESYREDVCLGVPGVAGEGLLDCFWPHRCHRSYGRDKPTISHTALDVLHRLDRTCHGRPIVRKKLRCTP